MWNDLLLWSVGCWISHGACQRMLNLELIVHWRDERRIDYDSWKVSLGHTFSTNDNQMHACVIAFCNLRSSEPLIVDSIVASLVSSKNTVLSKSKLKHPMLGQYRQVLDSVEATCKDIGHIGLRLIPRCHKQQLRGINPLPCLCGQQSIILLLLCYIWYLYQCSTYEKK